VKPPQSIIVVTVYPCPIPPSGCTLFGHMASLFHVTGSWVTGIVFEVGGDAIIEIADPCY